MVTKQFRHATRPRILIDSSPLDADTKGVPQHMYDADFETKLRFYNITNVDRVREIQSISATGEPYGELTVLLTGGLSAISLAVANELLSGGVRHLILSTSSAEEGIAAIQSLLGRWKGKKLPISYYCYNDKSEQHLGLDDLVSHLQLMLFFSLNRK